MELSEKKKQYDATYKRSKIKRIPLDMQITDYEKVKAAAENIGESVNGFIKRAIEARINSGL